MLDLRKGLEIDPHVLFCFESPSGDGLKCGVDSGVLKTG
jgi:hypothetical protein